MVVTYLFAMSASISLVRLISGAIQLILTIVPKPATYPNQSKKGRGIRAMGSVEWIVAVRIASILGSV